MQNCLMARLFQLWHCVSRSDRVGHFFNFFNIFFTCYKFWDSRYRKMKEKEESSHRPATRIFLRKNRHSVHLYGFKLLFLVACLLDRLIPDQFEWCIAAASMCALSCVCDCHQVTGNVAFATKMLDGGGR